MLCSILSDAITISDVDEVIQSQLMDQPHSSIMPSIPVLHSAHPYVRILEQPASRSLRFRYECEGRSAGSIVGATSTPDNRTYPVIQIVGYQGPAVVVVSCVTKEGPPYRPHPHNLVGRENCKRGICTMVNNPDMTFSFTSLGIQCVKRKDIEKSLQIRQDYQVDPFGTGFNHRSQAGSIDLNVVRLCFQVFIEGADNSCTKPLAPVVSEPIYDKKAMSDLTIMKLSHYSAPVAGGTEVILLCDKVAKDDIQVWFYEEQGTRPGWEAQAEFQPSDVHKQVAIAFRTPRYYNESVQQPVPVFVELRRPSDNIRGEPRPFQFLPMERDPEGLSRKRLKVEENCLERYLQENYSSGGAMASGPQPPIGVPRTLKQHTRTRIKAEPKSELPVGPCILEQFQGISTTATSAVPVSVSVMTVASPTPHLASVQPSNIGLPVGGSAAMASVVPGGMDITSVPLSHNETSPSRSILHGTTMSATAQAESTTVDDAMIEKFDSLDIDSGELRQLQDFSLTLTENLSTSLFDSASNLIEAPLQQPAQDEQENMPSEESLNRISQIQNELEALSKLCKTTEST